MHKIKCLEKQVESQEKELVHLKESNLKLSEEKDEVSRKLVLAREEVTAMCRVIASLTRGSAVE